MPINESAEAASLSEEDIARHIIEATKVVFTTMVAMDLEDDYPLSEAVTKFKCSITGMVGLAGTHTGVLSIHCPQTFARRITANMLGMEADEVDEDVNDALGEIANMLGGHVKQIISKGGLDLNLSIPTVISGEEYTVNHLASNDCVIIPFRYENEQLLVGLLLRKEH